MSARTIAFTSDGLAMTGRLIAPPGAKSVTVLLHGIPSGKPRDPGDAGYEGLAETLAEQGHAAFWFEMRGARGAPGDFSVQGWINDLNAAVAALDADREAGPLPKVLAGSSAGGAVSIAVATSNASIVAVATLAAPATYRFTGDAPAGLLARLRNIGIVRDPAFPTDLDQWAAEFDTWAAERHIAAVAPRPLLLVHGDADDVVPYHHAERLYAAADAPKELARIPDGGHQLRRDERAVACLLDWLENLRF